MLKAWNYITIDFHQEMGQEFSTIVQIIVKADFRKAIAWRSVSSQGLVSQYHGPKPELYDRYIDDCIGATSSTREELIQFITARLLNIPGKFQYVENFSMQNGYNSQFDWQATYWFR